MKPVGLQLSITFPHYTRDSAYCLRQRKRPPAEPAVADAASQAPGRLTTERCSLLYARGPIGHAKIIVAVRAPLRNDRIIAHLQIASAPARQALHGRITVTPSGTASIRIGVSCSSGRTVVAGEPVNEPAVLRKHENCQNKIRDRAHGVNCDPWPPHERSCAVNAHKPLSRGLAAAECYHVQVLCDGFVT